MSQIAPQELCLESEDGAGARYMYAYDDLPPEVRIRLQHSPINICIACLRDAATNMEYYDPSFNRREEIRPITYIRCIEEFEDGKSD